MLQEKIKKEFLAKQESLALQDFKDQDLVSNTHLQEAQVDFL